MIRRRALAAAALALAGAGPGVFDDLEQRHGGRLGVAIQYGPGPALLYRGDERFALCSTYKFLAAAAVLAGADRGRLHLDQRVPFGRDRLVPYSPVTERAVGGDGLTLAALCDAAVTVSDNTAGNLLLASLGGPAGLTGWLRSIGDTVTRLDRIEPELNENAPGDPRDTTTPAALLGTMQACLVGDALSPASRQQATHWLAACKTGASRLRAGFPTGWPAGDKTGSGSNGATNDLAILLPPGRPPVLVVALYTGGGGSDADRASVLAEVGRRAAAGLAPP